MSKTYNTLSLYRHLLRKSKSWTSAIPENTKKEREYILSQASLIRDHKDEKDLNKINEMLHDANIRMEIAEHYGIAFPRAKNLNPRQAPIDLNDPSVQLYETPQLNNQYKDLEIDELEPQH